MAEGSAITVKIGAETDGIEQGLKGIQNSLKNLESNTKSSAEGFGNSFTGMAGAVAVGELAVKAFTGVVNAGFAAARNVIQGFGEALDLGGRLSDLSASTGETAGKLLVLERAFDNSGIGADKVGSSIAKMQKNIEDARDGSGTAASAFAMMGVRVEELEGKLPTEQFKILSSGIQSIDDPTQRAAAAMGVFGKSGAELLPLLTNLDGELGEARDTVGSMAEIMDRRSSVFDAVGDRFKTIGEKVRDFAAGILDKALPAIDAITSALSRIDAAKIGQDLANSFLGGQQAMKGFQSAVDAISVGEISLAFKAFFESAKLQVMQTGNSIINIFSAAFQTVSEIIANVFRSDGPTLMVIKSAFDFVAGYVKEKVAGSLADTFAGMGPAFSKIADGLKQSAEAGATSAELALQRIPVAAELAAEDIGTNLAGSVDRFKENLSEANTEFFNTGEQAQKVADIEAEIATRVAATTAERAKSNEELEKEKEERAKIKAEAEAAAATERANAVALIEYETAINEAKAAGNEELVKTLESEKQQLEDQQEIAKLTKEYTPLLGGNADEAARLANNFVAAKNAAAAIGDRTAVVSVITKVDSAALDELLVKLRVADNPKLIEVICKVTGSDSLAEAEQKLIAIQNADANKTVVFDAIETKSWEETFDKLNGLPPVSSRQLAMSLTKTDNFDEALEQIWKVPPTKDVLLQLKAAGFESLGEFKQSLTDFPTQKEVEVICKALGVPDLESANQLLSTIIGFNNSQAEIKVAADTQPATAAIDAAAAPKQTTVTAYADTSSAKTSIDNLDGSAFTLSADADTSDAKGKVDLLGSAPLVFSLDGDSSEVQNKISLLSSQPVTLSLNGDTSTAEQKIADLSTKTATVPLDGDTSLIKTSLDKFAKTPNKITLDAADSISAIRSALAKPITMDLTGGGGEGSSSGLSGLVSEIKGILIELNRKLPTAALA